MNLQLILISFIPFWHLDHLAEGKPKHGTLAALLYSLNQKTGELIDFPERPCLTACPASTQQEIEFNDEVSIAKNSVFLRKFYPSKESQDDIPSNICEKPFKPSSVYNSENDTYEIGYELYYERNEIQLEYNKIDKYRSMNIYNEIINTTEPSNTVSIECKEGNNTKLNLSKRQQTLIFHWISVLSVKIFEHKKELDIDYKRNINDGLDHLKAKCEDYQLEDDFMKLLFSEEIQEKCLKDTPIPNSIVEKNPQKSFLKFYGYLKKSQIIPLWYFRARAAKLASCTRMNFIPVWKTIADQLKKIDLYLFAVQHEFNTEPYAIEYIIFGSSGILKLPKSTHSGEPQKIQLIADLDHRQLMTPIPEIIYRIISIYVDYQGGYKAVIIIHNNPTGVWQEDRICPVESEVTGWDEIKNEDSASGLTYVCPLTQEIYDKLAAHKGAIYNPDSSLKLDSFFNPRIQDFEELDVHEDRRDQINKTYGKLLQYVQEITKKMK